VVDIARFETTPFMSNCFVVREGDAALVIDPGEATDEVLAAVEGVRVAAVVNTHGHADHCGGNATLVERTGAPLLAHAQDLPLIETLPQQGAMFGVPFAPSPKPDRLIDDGDTLDLGPHTFTVRHTPGHSPGHVVLIGDGMVFAGDVLFAGSIGRTDLPGGSHATLLESINRVLLALPDETVVHSGHGPATTIGAERRGNPYLGML
jgi:glyoxylase-like metal-dependent hydrolase (beta-lactamase superfamily II)